MELLLHQWGDWPELYRNTDKTEATEIVIIDSQMNYRGKLDTYIFSPYHLTRIFPLSIMKDMYNERHAAESLPTIYGNADSI